MDRAHRFGIAIVATLLVSGGVAVAVNGGGGDDVATQSITPVERARGTSSTTSTTARRTTTPAQAVPAARRVQLQRFQSCTSLLDRLRRDALGEVTAYGMPGQPSQQRVATGAEMAPSDAAAGSAAGGSAAGAPSSATGPSADSSFSTTNVQEAGVDEPDVVKNDGRWAFTVVGGRLRSVAIGTDALAIADELDLGPLPSAELLRVGDDLVVLSPKGDGISTSILFVDVRDPRALSIVDRVDVEGTYLSARRIGDTVRLVVTQNGPAFAFTAPQSNDAGEVARALAYNRSVVGRARLAEWLPDVTFSTGQRLVPAPACDDAYVTPSFAGPGSTTVLTLSPSSRAVIDATSVMATASEVYATATRLYVATSAWGADARQPTTEIHRFDVSDPARSVYESSGSVAGQLLRPPFYATGGRVGQWSLSDYEGDLRVASTSMQPTGATASSVTVLRQVGDRLLPIGAVTGLGVGEQLFAVRFIGPMGYVVTYRNTDPLIVLDLSDPTRPRAAGELKVTGYSSYLQPVAGDTLLGLGQEDGNENGWADGVQASLFDVRDAERPRMLDRRQIGDDGSIADVEGDSRAFTWWPASRRAVVTITNRMDPTKFQGAVVLEIGGSSITEVGRVAQRARDGDRCAVPITRSRIVGDALLTFSAVGVAVNGLDDLRPRDVLRYPGATAQQPCPEPPGQTTTSTTSALRGPGSGD